MIKLFSRINAIFSSVNSKNDESRLSYIFYKIVDFDKHKQKYLLQCINTFGTFKATLAQLINDLDIIDGLHPLQACYLGLEYSKQNREIPRLNLKQTNSSREIHRYGRFQLLFQDRVGDLGFIDHTLNQQHIMDPRDIALSEDLIQEFDAAEAFHIGIFAGLKLNKPITLNQHNKTPMLYIVK